MSTNDTTERIAAILDKGDQLPAIYPDGTFAWVPNTYEGIKSAIPATIDFVIASEDYGFYINDNGMVDGDMLNIPASLTACHPLYGTVVLTAAAPDSEGETLPPPLTITLAGMAVAQSWRHVMLGFPTVGQTFDVRANPDTIPAPVITELTDEQFGRFLAEEDWT